MKPRFFYSVVSTLLPVTCICCVIVPSVGCKKDEPAVAEPVVLYTSVDETFAKEVVARYERATGRRVSVVGDSEAGKTTGLVKRLRLEKDRPSADVFWSGEQSQTVLLADDGLLAAYQSPVAADIPAQYRDPQYRWTGIALRARVVAYDPARTKIEDLPRTWEELAEPRFAGITAIANPLFGTTRGHVAAMSSLWGPERFRAFVTGLVEGGVTVADGNATAVRKLIAGDIQLALTDSDDVITAQRKGHKVEMVFPDMGDGGTMIIPNTIALVAGAPHPDEARALIDYLLSAEVEEMLALSDSGNYPVRESLRSKLGMTLPPESKVSFGDIAASMPSSIDACREILLK